MKNDMIYLNKIKLKSALNNIFQKVQKDEILIKKFLYFY